LPPYAPPLSATLGLSSQAVKLNLTDCQSSLEMSPVFTR
jgi:hypothetical protein